MPKESLELIIKVLMLYLFICSGHVVIHVHEVFVFYCIEVEEMRLHRSSISLTRKDRVRNKDIRVIWQLIGLVET